MCFIWDLVGCSHHLTTGVTDSKPWQEMYKKWVLSDPQQANQPWTKSKHLLELISACWIWICELKLCNPAPPGQYRTSETNIWDMTFITLDNILDAKTHSPGSVYRCALSLPTVLYGKHQIWGRSFCFLGGCSEVILGFFLGDCWRMCWGILDCFQYSCGFWGTIFRLFLGGFCLGCFLFG